MIESTEVGMGSEWVFWGDWIELREVSRRDPRKILVYSSAAGRYNKHRTV